MIIRSNFDWQIQAEIYSWENRRKILTHIFPISIFCLLYHPKITLLRTSHLFRVTFSRQSATDTFLSKQELFLIWSTTLIVIRKSGELSQKQSIFGLLLRYDQDYEWSSTNTLTEGSANANILEGRKETGIDTLLSGYYTSVFFDRRKEKTHIQVL